MTILLILSVVIIGAVLIRFELRYRRTHHNLRGHVRTLPTQTIQEMTEDKPEWVNE